MSQKERFNSMAAEYDAHAEIIVPYYSDIQECICSVLRLIRKPKLRVLDVGAGSGILLKRIAGQFKTEGVWQDFSQDFLDLARSRLHGQETQFVVSDLNEPDWHKGIQGGFDAIVSSNAIHHLQNRRKKELYHELSALLAAGGVLLNADEVRGESDVSYLMSLQFWDAHVRKRCAEGLVSEKMEEVWNSYAERNIENFPNEDPNPKDIHCPLAVQLDWLREIPLQDVECFWKGYLWALFGGFKPV